MERTRQQAKRTKITCIRCGRQATPAVDNSPVGFAKAFVRRYCQDCADQRPSSPIITEVTRGHNRPTRYELIAERGRPDCGYKLGSAWLKRELPAEVVRWAQTFGKDA